MKAKKFKGFDVLKNYKKGVVTLKQIRDLFNEIEAGKNEIEAGKIKKAVDIWRKAIGEY